MKAVIQRVLQAQVTINGAVYSKIGRGYLLLVGIEKGDTEAIVRKMAEKTVELRICDDGNGKMNLSLKDIRGEALIVSQFTLLADCRKGRRPGFSDAALPETAKELYEYYCSQIRESGIKVSTGVFQADMKVALVNDGPVTIILDSKEVCRDGK